MPLITGDGESLPFRLVRALGAPVSEYGFVIMIGSSESEMAGGPRAGPDRLSLATGVPVHGDRDGARRLDS